MKRSVIFLTVLITFMTAARLNELKTMNLELAGASVGYPLKWDLHLIGVRVFPIPGQTIFSRIGVDFNVGRQGNFYNISDTERNFFLELGLFRITLLLFPASFKEKGISKSTYSYVYGGGGAFSFCRGSAPNAEGYAGGNARFLTAGIGVSYRSIIDIQAGYLKGDIAEYLGVDAEARLVDYSAGIELQRPYITAKISFGSAFFSLFE